MRRATTAAQWRDDERGVSAIEFALLLPLMVTIYLGGYQMTQGVSAYRKVAITTRSVVDLATQYQSMSATDMSNVLNASAQVMAPFATSSLTIVLTEFTTSSNGVATVTWSKSLNGTPLTVGAQVTLPTGVCQNGASVVRGDVSFVFNPAIGSRVTGPIKMSDSLYMSPRQVSSITYTGS